MSSTASAHPTGVTRPKTSMRPYRCAHRAVTRSVQDSQPLLPFLYCTKTLQQHNHRFDRAQQQRCFAVAPRSCSDYHPPSSPAQRQGGDGILYSPANPSSRSRLSHEPSPDRRPPRGGEGRIPRSNDGRPFNDDATVIHGAARWGHDLPSGTDPRQPGEQHSTAHHRPRRADPFGRKTGSATLKLSHGRVPFEMPDRGHETRSFQDMKKESALPDSSLTASEYRGFQSLLALQQKLEKKEDSQDADPEEEKIQALNDILEKAIGMKVLPQAETQSTGLPTSIPASTPEDVTGRADGNVNRIKALMMDCRTDAMVWSTLQKEVFAPLRRISLPELRESMSIPYEDALTEDEVSTSQSPPQTDSDEAAQNKRLMQSLPAHLMNFQSVLASRFPSSLHTLAIIPYLQRQGDAVFALGASTELYNIHLRQLHLKHYDIVSLVKTLQEMHDKVYDFDGETLDIVQTVLDEADLAHRRPLEAPTASLWDCEQMRSLHRALHDWRDRIEEQVSDRALRDSHNHE